MSSTKSSAALVCDIGTTNSRVGRAGEIKPDYMHHRTLASPVAVWNSRIVDLAAFELRLNESKLVEAGSDLLMIESVAEPDSVQFKKRLCELMFEKRQLRAMSFQLSPVVSCFANARQTAVVLDMSGGGCTASAVIDGWCLTGTNVERSDLGGEQVDSWLTGITNGPTSQTKDAFNKLQKMRTQRESQTYKLPDSTVIADKVTNALFDPSPLNNAASFIPLHELVFTAATKQTSNEVRRALLNNIVLCGGLSRTEGVALRLANELNAMARMDQPRVIACGPESRDLVPWIGGSILASLPVFKELCITKSEFAEGGIDAVLKKCA
jgi:actin-related protein